MRGVIDHYPWARVPVGSRRWVDLVRGYQNGDYTVVIPRKALALDPGSLHGRDLVEYADFLLQKYPAPDHSPLFPDPQDMRKLRETT